MSPEKSTAWWVAVSVVCFAPLVIAAIVGVVYVVDDLIKQRRAAGRR